MFSLSRTRATDRVWAGGFQPARAPQKTASCPYPQIATARSSRLRRVCAGWAGGTASQTTQERDTQQGTADSDTAYLSRRQVLMACALGALAVVLLGGRYACFWRRRHQSGQRSASDIEEQKGLNDNANSDRDSTADGTV